VSSAGTPAPTPFEIPLIAAPQTLSITLSGIIYQLRVLWNVKAGLWMLDISDNNSDLIVGGIPLVTGADLLEQYAYLEFGGQLIVQTDNDPDLTPTFANLGQTAHLFWLPDPT
jgi:hypothetical protein